MLKTKNMKKISTKFAFFFLLTLFAQSVWSQERIIKFNFSVLDESGNAVSGLKLSDVQILQDKKNLLLKSIESNAENPLEVVIMIDASASQERMLPFEKKFAESIIDQILIRGKDKVAIVKFSGEVGLAQDLTDNLSQSKKQLDLIKFEPPAGYIGGGIIASQTAPNSKQAVKSSTSIWDSIGEVTKAFAKSKNDKTRQLVILISDGVNTYGDSKLKEAIFSSIKTQIPIHAVGIGDDFYDGVDKKTLKKLTEQVGGILVLPDNKGKNTDKQIAILRTGLRSSYEATLVANQTASKDSLQEIKITIVNPELNKKKLQIIQPKGFIVSDK